MPTRFKKIATLAATLGSLLVSRAALAINTGLETTANVAGLSTANVDIATRIGQIIGIALSLVGVVFLVLMVYGGFIWMTAAGDSEKIKKAKGIIINAVIGIIIVLASYAITFFILDQVGNATDSNVGTES